jgi:uncharacterized protein (UPF0261 family)
MSLPVLLLATMNTKGAEALYLDRAIRAGGAQPLSMDISMRYGETPLKAEIMADEVARAGGSSLKELSASRDMAANMETMVAGASLIASRLTAEGKIGGIIGIGGYTGTFVIAPVMQVLPFGLPKVMVSSAAAMRGLSGLFLKTSDIMFFHSVVEIAGLSAPVRNVLDRAACAFCAMLRAPVIDFKTAVKRAVAMTMMSPCEKCASLVRSALEAEGCEVVGFHANGVGDRAMEEMIGAGHFRGVIDLAPGGVGENLYGFARDAGPDRLEAAGKSGIPQIISTCSVNHITPLRSRLSFAGRPRYELDRLRTWLRATPRELRRIAEAFAYKLNKSTGPVKVVIPLRGWSSVDRPGSPTYDPEGDGAFSRTLRKKLNREIEVVEVDANMEDVEFARAITDAASGLLRRADGIR